MKNSTTIFGRTEFHEDIVLYTDVDSSVTVIDQTFLLAMFEQNESCDTDIKSVDLNSDDISESLRYCMQREWDKDNVQLTASKKT